MCEWNVGMNVVDDCMHATPAVFLHGFLKNNSTHSHPQCFHKHQCKLWGIDAPQRHGAGSLMAAHDRTRLRAAVCFIPYRV